MVVHEAGDDPNTTLTQYVGPTRVREQGGKIYLFDAGKGEIIAELTDEAADAVRRRKPGHIGVDDHHGNIKNPDLTMED